MTETNAQIRTDGDPAFPTAPNTESNNSAGSQPGEKNESVNAPSSGGDEKNNTQSQHENGFLDHPRWKEREDNWNKRFNDQETRHQDDMRKIREEFGGARQANAENTDIPAWFGGDKAMWDDYRKHEDQRLKEAEERAYKRVTEAKQQEEGRVKEATDYMRSEMATIESDATLNPNGEKLSEELANKLLKITIDNDLIDSKGRWNYRAGWQILRSQLGQSTTPTNKERRAVAGATTSESRAESKPAAYKTSDDFKKNRPW